MIFIVIKMEEGENVVREMDAEVSNELPHLEIE